MNATDYLANVRVASPCSARWADMDGDARSRFCARCHKHVYNLSELNAEDAASLVQAQEGKLCVRFYRRSDGTMLTADCPIGAARWTPRLRKLALVTVPLLILAAVVSVCASTDRNAQKSTSSTGKLTHLLDQAVWKVKGWLGMQPPVMGGMCAPPKGLRPIPPTPTSSSTNADLRGKDLSEVR